MRAAAPIIPKIPKVFPPAFIAFAPPVYSEPDAEADPLALPELEVEPELEPEDPVVESPEPVEVAGMLPPLYVVVGN